MKINIESVEHCDYRCDLCGFEWHPDYWAHNANGGTLDIVKDGFNGKKKFEHLCIDCRAEIQDAVERVLQRRRNCHIVDGKKVTE